LLPNPPIHFKLKLLRNNKNEAKLIHLLAMQIAGYYEWKLEDSRDQIENRYGNNVNIDRCSKFFVFYEGIQKNTIECGTKYKQ
jgi:hypothetical protein